MMSRASSNLHAVQPPALPGIMHIVDSLDAGGLERVAVNLANLLPRSQYRSFVCTTRHDGSLANLLTEDVTRVRLERRGRFDVRGVRRLVAAIRAQNIQLLHAHGSAVFIACVASLFRPYPAVVWHDHYGRYLFDDRPVWLYRLAASRVDAVIAVNSALADWARVRLAVRSDRVTYIPNFAVETQRPQTTDMKPLPGTPGGRIVCVASLRPQKDHETLLAAHAQVVRQVPKAHLLLVGGTGDARYEAGLRQMVDRLALGRYVSFLGHRDDVSAILRAADIGVLSSASEGFPLALVEYGIAGLPVVATSVGQCSEVLGEGRAGLLVPPRCSEALADKLVSLLQSTHQRRTLGEHLHQRVGHFYAPGRIVQQVCQVYDTVLPKRSAPTDMSSVA